MKEQGEETTILAPLPERDVCQVNKQKCTSQEFKMTIDIGGYDMDGVMLDLGSDVNILPKKSWEVMGKPKLVLVAHPTPVSQSIQDLSHRSSWSK
jgi:hypothetical protein